MHLKKTFILAAFIAVLLPSLGFPASSKHKVLFEKAKFTMETKGDMEGAIKLFNEIIEKYPGEREYAAKSQLYIGLCYEKSGLKEAQKAYQKVVDSYPEQTEAVKAANEKLSLLLRAEALIRKEDKDIVIRKFMDGTGAGFVHGAPSPDGKYFSFLDWATYPNDIVIKEIGTGEEIRLRNQIDLNYEGDVGTPYDSTWSPDSKKIAYTWENDEAKYIELRVIEIANPEPDVLIRVSYSKGWVKAEDWSPDGQHILVQLTKNHQDQLGLISIADGSFHLLKKFDDSDPTSAKFSPDGHHIAYDLTPNKESTNHDIYVMSIDGKRETKLTSHPSHDYLLDWSPTGKKILFASDRTGTTDMWSISFDEGTPREDPKLVTENIGVIGPLGSTRDGSFYFSTSGSWWDIYTVTIDPETGKVTTPPTEVPLPYQGYNRHSEWSPDGKYLAYISVRGHLRRPDILCIYTKKTGSIKEFDYKQDANHPSWFADSQSILVNNTDVLNIATGEITPLIKLKKDEAIYSSSISSDNKYIYYTTRNKNWKIHSIKSHDLETEKEKELYRTPDDNLTMALSPDGKQLAVLLRHNENTRILKILSTTESSEKDIYTFKQNDYGYISVAWSPDGRYIYFSKKTGSEEKRPWELWRIPAAGGDAENLGVKMFLFTDISIHPDGRQITFTSFVGKEKPGGVWVMENFLPEEKEDKTFNIRKVWADPDVDILGAPSPDGRYLSYVDWDTGDLAIREIATGKKRRLTNKGSWDESNEFAEYSRWSPDGKQIIYDWYNEKFVELRIIGLDGSKPRILYSNEEVEWAYTCDWSPDGRQILACFIRKEVPGQMVLVSTADGSVRVLKILDQGWPENISFSPDGRYIVYDFPPKEDSPDHDIYLMSTDGSGEISLIKHPAHDFVLGWAPDGKNILFASDRTGTFDAWVIQVTDGKPHGTPELIKKGIGQILPMGFTQKSSFYYGISHNNMNVYIAKLDTETGKILIPPKKAIKRFEGFNTDPNYSPDGKYLGYLSQRGHTYSGRNKVLCIRNLETDDEREFPSNIITPYQILKLHWSPDCRSILVKGIDDNNDCRGIFRIDVQTGDVTTIVLSDEYEQVIFGSCRWSRDGKAIFYGRHDWKAKIDQILVRDLESGTEKELYRADGRFYLSCSPDGKWLAFMNRGEKGVLRIMPAAGGEPRELYRLEKEEGFGPSTTWSADGKYILFTKQPLKQNYPKRELYRISAEGGEPEKLGLEMLQINNLSVHPDGKHIAFSSLGSNPKFREVWVMENFLPE